MLNFWTSVEICTLTSAILVANCSRMLACIWLHRRHNHYTVLYTTSLWYTKYCKFRVIYRSGIPHHSEFVLNQISFVSHDGVMGRASDSQSRGRGFHFRLMILDKLFTVTKQYNLVPAKRRWCSATGGPGRKYWQSRPPRP